MKSAQVEIIDQHLIGEGILKKSVTVGDLKNHFANEQARAGLSQNKLLYEVEACLPVNEGTMGGLFWGLTNLQPGKIGDEYFMTRGHFHSISDRAEYYWGMEGEGVLILMDRNRKTWAETMKPGSLHYIPAHTAHRVANTGNEVLSFAACWPADAGHDYEEIANNGFSARLFEINEKPELINTDL
jgi:glucose-6-phosphate isomerase